MTEVVWLQDAGTADPSRVGGKAASLGQLIAAGLPVPTGFVLPTDAYAASRDHSGHTEEISHLLRAAHGEGGEALARACEQLRALVADMSLDAASDRSLRAAYAHLCVQRGDPTLPVAVRSSAVGEDSDNASFAGEHDTFLWVRGADDVVAAVRRCWASLFTDRAVSYRTEMGLDHMSLAMGVVVQEMVEPISAGVAFTINPIDGDRSVVAIDAAWGFGEAVVSGEVTPDSFLVDKVMHAIVSRVISEKERELVLDADDRISLVEISPPRSRESSLTDDQVVAVAKMARRAERHVGSPQDIEWALVALPDGTWSVVLLQARPETVWSRLGADSAPEEATGDSMSSIVTTLIAPLHAHDEEGA